MLNRVLKIIFYIVLGCLIGVFFCNYRYFTLDPSIELGDLLVLAITSLIGVYIADNIQKHQSSDRKEKDFIIDEILEIRKELNRLTSLAETGVFPFDETKTLYKSINQRLLQLQSLLDLGSIKKQKCDLTNLKALFKSTRRAILNVSPVGNDITLAVSQKNTVSRNLEKVVKEVFKLIININKA